MNISTRVLRLTPMAANRLGGTAASYDQRIFDECWRAAPAMSLPWLRGVTVLGGHEVVWPVVCGAGLIGAVRDRRPTLAAEALLWLVGATVARRAVAERVARPRPDRRRWRTPASGPSCPSRHATMAVVGWGLAAELLGYPPRRRAWLVTPVAAAVGASRVSLGVHWPSDVLAGWAFGAVVLGLRRLTPALGPRRGPRRTPSRRTPRVQQCTGQGRCWRLWPQRHRELAGDPVDQHQPFRRWWTRTTSAAPASGRSPLTSGTQGISQ